MTDRSTPPEVRRLGRLRLAHPDDIVLDNGLTLHMLRGGDTDVARLSLQAAGGRLDGSCDYVAPMMAEMLREGSRSHSGAEVAEHIDFNGAWLTANAMMHRTAYELSAVTRNFRRLLPIFVDTYAYPTFDPKPFGAIHRKSLSDLDVNLTKVSFLANNAITALIAGDGNPAARGADRLALAAITRGTLAGFHTASVDARGIHAFLSGHLDSETVEATVRALSDIPSSRNYTDPRRYVAYTPAPPETVTVDRPGSMQSAVALAIPVIGRSHPDYIPLRMAVIALGGYFGSRLMLNIREDKGYTYGISAALVGTVEGGYVLVSAQCDNRYTGLLIDEIKNELTAMSTTPLSDSELTNLRLNLESTLATTLDSPFTQAEYYSTCLNLNIPTDYFDRQQDALEALSAEGIAEISRRYLDPGQARIAIAGDLSKIK